MSKNLVFYLFIFCASLAFTACGPDYIFEQENPIAEQQWTYEQPVTFDINIADTTHRYNLHLDIHHDQSYPFQNLYVMIYTDFPSGKKLENRISVDLMNKVGLWNGKCAGETCNLRVVMQENTHFNEMGKYTFRFEQFMRQDSLPGLHSLAMRVEQVSK